MTSFQKKLGGTRLSGFIKYLESDILETKAQVKNTEDVLDLEFIYSAHEWLASHLVTETFHKLEESRMHESNEDKIFNDNLYDLVETAKVLSKNIMLKIRCIAISLFYFALKKSFIQSRIQESEMFLHCSINFLGFTE